jgi:hypothetical protein
MNMQLTRRRVEKARRTRNITWISVEPNTILDCPKYSEM